MKLLVSENIFFFFSASEPDGMHVIIDRHLITGQNDPSTLSAVQNLILLCNARLVKILNKV